MLTDQMTHFLALQIWREVNESNCKKSLFISLKKTIFSYLKDKFLSYKIQYVTVISVRYFGLFVLAI